LLVLSPIRHTLIYYQIQPFKEAIVLKKTVLLFAALLIAFAGIWAFKLTRPLTPLDAYAYGIDAESGAWWHIGQEPEQEITAESDWRLDPEIPGNYIPVLGADELYMVIGDDGKIIGYRHRYKAEDGSWIWEDVDPNIPENYELVEGFTDLYRVVGADGSIRYFRYTRNEDDTYFFTECDADGNPLEDNNPDGDEIPDNFVRITGNVYAVYNEHGVLIGYKERILNPDGTYSWIDVDEPVIPERSKLLSSGRTSGDGSGGGDSGDSWRIVDLQIPGYSGGSGGDINVIIDPGSTVQTKPKDDGGYVETETYTDSKTEGGYTVIYETTITKTYNKDGILVSTKKDGPHEISRYNSIPGGNDPQTPNPARIEATLQAEYTRVTNGLSFDTNLANSVLAGLNAQRAAAGLAPLAMAQGDLYMAACLKAADMAIYNHSDFDSPMYGTINNLLVRFGVEVGSPCETLWKTSAKTADQINERFMAQSASYESRMSEYCTQAAIAIVSQNGYIYIAEIFN
jgi:uncharacterized protein YkwD